MKKSPFIPYGHLQGIRGEFASLITETEDALAEMAAVSYRMLAKKTRMSRRNVLHGVRLMGTVHPDNDQMELSNGATVHDALLATEASLAADWPRTARTVRLWTPQRKRMYPQDTVGVSTDGTAFGRTPLHMVNPIGSDKDDFAKHMHSEVSVRRQYARTYAGAAAVGHYVAEGLQVGFGLEVNTDVFSQLQDRWLSPDISDATGVRHDLDWVLPTPPAPPKPTPPHLYIGK